MQPPSSRTLGALLHEMAQRYPSHEAVVAGAARRTYGELARDSARAAAALRELGVGRGSRVGLLMSNRIEWLQVAFGAASVGASLIAFSTWSKPAELEYLLEHSGCELLISATRVGSQDFTRALEDLVPEAWRASPGRWRSARFPRLKELILVADDEPSLPNGARDYREWLVGGSEVDRPRPPEETPERSDVAFVLYTSGSTARPKGVPLQHYGLVENGFNIGERQGLRPADRVLVPAPLFWSYGSANALMAILSHGATLILQERFEAEESLSVIEREQCTSIYTLPNMTHALIRHPSFRPERTSSLRKGMTIGNPEDVRAAAQILGAKHVCNVYGSTETYGNCCVTPHDAPLETRANSQGPPLLGVSLRIVDPDTRKGCDPGQTGEIEVGGYLTPGYWQPSEEQLPVTEDGFLRTGDLGWIDSGGYLHFAGRLKELIKTGGINVSPLEVEEFLSRLPGVENAIVVGASDSTRGEIVVAFVQLQPGSTATVDELQDSCRSGLSSYKVPRRFVLMEDFPVTDTGKTSRRALREMAESILRDKPD